MSNKHAKESLRRLRASTAGRVFLTTCLLCLVFAAEARAQNWDFETGDLRGWTATGTAFNSQPTYGDNVGARRPGERVGHQGNYWIGTYERRHTPDSPFGGVQGDEPTGTLTSPQFDITQPLLTFLIGGGNRPNHLRVELLIRIRLPDEPPPEPSWAAAFAGIGEIVTLPDGEYFVGAAATGRNTEAMRREVLDISDYMHRRARIRIVDNLDTGPWGHINVDDFQFTGGSPSVIAHVTDEVGADVAGAEVFLNGILLGTTDAPGNRPLGPISTADRITARQRVFEHRTGRDHHSTGSLQNWNYRVYNTDLRVNNSGAVTGYVVRAPDATQELQLNRRNTVIGLHLMMSVEWDASEYELRGIRDGIIVPASQFLYNATDGQFFIEQVEVFDNAFQWDNADYRILADQSYRAHGTRNCFDGGCVSGGWMRMSRSDSPDVYIHEFGHYGFDLADEYADVVNILSGESRTDPNVHCTANVDLETCDAGVDSAVRDYGSYQPKASCIMWIQGCASKFCSNRPENPHVRGTNQGDASCWSRIAEKFRDADRLRERQSVRWILQTPETRGAIVGMLPRAPDEWLPRVDFRGTSRERLCRPYDVEVVDAGGRLLANVEVWNRTHYDQNILEGKTSGDDGDTPANEAGRITLTGVHVGDRLNAGGEPYLVNECDRASLDTSPGREPFRGLQPASLNPALPALWPSTSTADGEPFAFAQQKGGRVIRLSSAPFDLYVSFEPDAATDGLLIRALAAAELKAPPQVEFSLGGSTKVETVAMRFDEKTGTYVGAVGRLSPGAEASARVTASDTSGRSVTRNVGVTLAAIIPKDTTELFSADGQLSLTVMPGALPADARVAIGSGSPVAAPAGDGDETLSGPFNVTASTGRKLNKPAALSFRLPAPGGKRRSSVSMFDPQSFAISHYNPATERWEKIGGTLLKGVNIVTSPVSELGAYVLTARRLAAPPPPKLKVSVP